jgi:hypothetical protein
MRDRVRRVDKYDLSGHWCHGGHLTPVNHRKANALAITGELRHCAQAIFVCEYDTTAALNQP